MEHAFSSKLLRLSLHEGYLHCEKEAFGEIKVERKKDSLKGLI